MDKKIKIGIIGLGAMGKGHYKNIKTVPEFEITALSDVNMDGMKDYSEAKFASGEELINKGDVEAIVIVTPHFDHVPLAVAALKKGLHVLIEKPVSVQMKDAKILLDAHKDKGRVVACVFNNRTSQVYMKMREMVSSGELGAIQRVNMTVTQWFRSDAYFKSAGWRATWAGEGGGALLNQCPHSLDLLQWITGMPKRVTANVGFGKHHDIEVEDEVTAILEYPNGAVGTFVTSTAEAPGLNRIEIAGDQGLLICDNNNLTYTRNEVRAKKFLKETEERFAVPPVWNVSIPAKVPTFDELHQNIHRNFKDAILKGVAPVASLQESVNSLELANAMLLSGFLNKPVDLPIDSEIYAAELEKRMKTSRFKKG
ncbi:MAG: Gfo/Idh/MocA family oxidoreductase [Fibrobacteres bacterium]|nr:Gfo/Idh/MocA family oxidoreductase [Fibrobacterota bacterium]